MQNENNNAFVWVVVDGAITHQSPRAWAFDTEEAAVKFRCEKVEMHSRRPHSLSPVFRCTVNSANEMDNLEIDWRKYQLEKPDRVKKFQ